MKFSLEKSLEILSRTPDVLEKLLQDLPKDWSHKNEGPGTWSAFDVIGHLIHGEKTDWIPRMNLILSDNPDRTFEPYDRFAQKKLSKGKTLEDLLSEFKTLREINIGYLKSVKLTKQDLNKKGIHPALGEVSLSELIACWTVHDLNHLSQISRTLAHQYETEVGPWKAFLGILNL